VAHESTEWELCAEENSRGFLPVETVTQAFPQSGTTLYVDSTRNKKPWNISNYDAK
jgi:hypothetical protein